MRYLGFLVFLTFLAVGCGANESSTTAGTESQDGEESSVGSSETALRGSQPPDLRVAAGSQPIDLVPYAYCWNGDETSVCADGAPVEPLPALSLSGDQELAFEYPLAWEFQAELLPDGDYCEGFATVTFDADGSSVNDLGPAGHYVVQVFGRGKGGDGAWAFELTIDDDRVVPGEFVQALWFPGVGEAPDSEAPFTAVIGNLRQIDSVGDAAALVTTGDGETIRVELQAVNVATECSQSQIAFQAAADFTERVLAAGPAPFEVVIEYPVEGSTRTSDSIRWPDSFPTNSNESARVAVN